MGGMGVVQKLWSTTEIVCCGNRISNVLQVITSRRTCQIRVETESNSGSGMGLQCTMKYCRYEMDDTIKVQFPYQSQASQATEHERLSWPTDWRLSWPPEINLSYMFIIGAWASHFGSKSNG